MIAPNAIHHTDCVKGMGNLEGGSVDLAFADPPFNIGYEYDVYDDAREHQHYLDWSKEWIGGVFRALKPAGTFWLAIGDEYAAELKLLAQEIGFTCRSWVIWYYTFGVNCKKKFSRSHAHLFHFVKDPKAFTFNDREIRVPSARQLVYADGRANPDGRLPDDTWILRPQDVPDGITATGDTWYFPRVAGTFKERAGFHGCQMPEQLLGRIIRCCSNPGELVLDPFSGSATTLVVAKKLGRKWIGFDLSEEYVQRGRARVDSVAVGKSLEGAVDPLTSVPSTPGLNPIDAKRMTRSPNGRKANGISRGARAPGGAARVKRVPDLDTGIVEAFRRASQGFSVDRVLADDELCLDFTERCARIGLPGTDIDWNRALFRIRKAGKLQGLPPSRRTEIDWDHADRFLFASEIALRQMADLGHSLDEVLCDQVLKSEFDRIAARFAPGFDPLQYRWGAFKLRKSDSERRKKSRATVGARMSKLRELSPDMAGNLCEVAGLYLICRQDAGVRKPASIYAGATCDLGNRLDSVFEGQRLRDVWKEHAGGEQLLFQVQKLSGPLPALFPRQYWLIKEFAPKLNYSRLAG